MSERMTWKEIQAKYPDQWVGLIEVEYEPDNDATIQSAIVKHTDKTMDELLAIQVDTNGEMIGRYTTPDNVLFVGTQFI